MINNYVLWRGLLVFDITHIFIMWSFLGGEENFGQNFLCPQSQTLNNEVVNSNRIPNGKYGYYLNQAIIILL